MFFKQTIPLIQQLKKHVLKGYRFKSDWTNQDNILFYRKKPMDGFAKAAGLETCCDLDVVLPYLDLSGAVCEVGSGRGRVLQGLLDRGFTLTQLTAIERDDRCIQYLKHHFGDALTVHHQDAQHVLLKRRYQAFLLMWGFVCEIPVEEQLKFLFHLQLNLATSGVIACDTPRYGEPNKSNITHFNGQNIRIEQSNQPTWYGYIPQPSEMMAYGDAMGMTCQALPYQTTTQRERVIYLYEKEATDDKCETQLPSRLTH